MKQILKRMNQSDNMDFCENLSNIQSILNYANDNIRPLARIQFRGGNIEIRLWQMNFFDFIFVCFYFFCHRK